jgi:hypothetical protein
MKGRRLVQIVRQGRCVFRVYRGGEIQAWSRASRSSARNRAVRGFRPERRRGPAGRLAHRRAARWAGR